MDNDKTLGYQAGSGEDKPAGNEKPAQGGGNAPRARNRTVMLTPEITGQVRARLAQDIGESNLVGGGGGHEAPHNTDSGFVPVTTRGRAGFDSSDTRGMRGAQQPYSPPPSAGGAPAAAAQPASSQNAGVVFQKKTPVIGFLVSFDSNPNGDIYELRTGRIIVTSEPSGAGNFFIVNDETVSPMHAILRIAASGEVQVLDQLSEFGTKIKRFASDEEIELSGEKGSLEHGDLVRFGNRNFHVCIIQKGKAE